ncbi:unnamed protein product [Caenorhabditis sp. 36 PRJEB53466]|nr:unnamed protein product [Caenorhabditis sp. 36 PRJEB53466]
MFDLTNHESDASESGNKYGGDGGVGTSRRHSDLDEEALKQKRRDLADLATWLSGLGATKLSLDNPHDLCDGRAFAELLHEIDKSFFDDTWLEKMPAFTSKSNIVVKRSNLRKLWRKMSDYIAQELNRQISSDSRWKDIDERVDGIEETDLPVAVDLGMTVVTFAHIGRHAAEYVQYSQELSAKHKEAIENVARMIGLVMKELPEVQSFLEVSALHDSLDDTADLNISLQETGGFSANTSTANNGNGPKNSSRRRTMSNNNQMHLEAQLDALRQEKDGLSREVDRLTKALDQAQLNTSVSSESNDLHILEKQNEELRAKRREAEERAHELEAQIEQHRLSIQELTAENEVLGCGQKEFGLLKNELQTAQDEVEVWRSKVSGLTIDAELAKKREKEVKELQGQVKSLTSRLEHHVKQSTIDEDHKTVTTQLRQQIGTLKALNENLEVKLSSKERMILELESQLIQQKEKVKALDDRKDSLIAERNQLQDQLTFANSVTPRSLHESMFEGGNLSFDDKPKLSLEIENKRLVERIEELEALEPLQGEIILLKSRNGVLDEEIIVLTKRKEELEKQVAELQEMCTKSQQQASGDVVELKVQLEKATVEVERMRDVEARAETRLADVEDLLKAKTQKVEEYTNALQRAKEVIDNLEERSRPVGEETGTSVQQFKDLQSENEQLRKKLEKLETELVTVTTALEQENRLITTAAHHMVLNRSIDDVMSLRASAGADSSDVHNQTGPQTLLETQKMSNALPYRSASGAFGLPSAIVCLTGLMLLFAVVWMLIKMYSDINAPPRA